MNEKTISITLKVWRQEGPEAKGHLETHEARDISTDISFLEMLDIVNAGLQKAGIEPIAFESNCREGICGCCGATVNGRPHGPRPATTLCQLHMRHFHDGDVIVVEPFRATAFPIIRDLVVDRSALDRIIQAGGYVSVRTGQAPTPTPSPSPKNAPKPHSDPRNASAAARALRRVRMRPRASSRRPKSGNSPRCHKDIPNGNNASGPWRAGWTRKVSGRARNTTNAMPYVPSRSASKTSPR